MKSVIRYLFLLLFLIPLLSFSQEKVNGDYIYNIKRAVDPINIDGEVNEKSWKEAEVARDFFMVQPMDTSFSLSKTEVKMSYDDHNLYLLAVNFDSLPGKWVVESMKRDFSFNNNENFLVFIDPYNDMINGFSFGANAAGAQWDGTQSNGGQVNLNWDNKWESEVRQYEDRWIFEAAIPFKTLRYSKENLVWGINFSRLDLKLREKSSWAPVPTQFATATLAYAGNLVWNEPPPGPGLNVSLIPYVTGSASKNFEEGSKTDYEPDIGADAKISITPGLNLDLTVNPDFSQVEVDRQVTNLSRFELFFPERRQFFLENNDLFADFGFDGFRPFFSRRIGLDSPIRFGGRLSGKINNKWRVGMMDVMTGENSADSIPSQNYAVMALQRNVFSRSNISAIFIDRESINLDYTKHEQELKEYNRNIGLEYNLASRNNIWRGKFFVHKSFTPGVEDKDYTYAGNLIYSTKKITTEAKVGYSGINYNSEVGYIPRNGFNYAGFDINYRFFVKSSWLLSHGPQFESGNFYDISWDLTDNENVVVYGFQLLDRSEFGIGYGFDFIRLLEPFDPTNSGGALLPEGSEYHNNGFGFQYMSSPARLFTWGVHAYAGGYYGGNIQSVQGNLSYRFQPYGSLSLNYSYNDIELDDPYKSENFWLISPRMDITFTNKIFLTTFVQYNEQAENFNINSRFQWRFKPASDFYLVYTENYLPENFSVKNRAIVFKLTYWYNL